MTKITTKPKTLDQAYRQVLEELFEMFLKKHKDYGKGNILANKDLGIAIRMSEKVERLKNLLMKEAMGEKPVNESIDETFIDMAVYGVIGVLYRRGQFQSLDVDEKLMK